MLPRLFLPILLAGPVWAQNDEEPTVRTDFGYSSEYVFRGVKRAGDSGQAAVELVRGNFCGGVWTNLPTHGGKGREVALSAAYGWVGAPGSRFEVSLAQRWYGSQPATAASDSLEAGLTGTAAPICGVTPSLAYYHDFRFHADTVQASLMHSIPLAGWGAYLDLNIYAGWATGNNWQPVTVGSSVRDTYCYWGAEAHLPYRVGPHSTVIVGCHYAETHGRSATSGPTGLGGGARLWFTLDVSLDF